MTFRIEDFILNCSTTNVVVLMKIEKIYLIHNGNVRKLKKLPTHNGNVRKVRLL
jgi:hypothetical protein